MLESERLILRPFRVDDADDLFACLSRENVVRYEPYAPFSREQAAHEAVRRANDPCFLAVCLRDGDGNPIWQDTYSYAMLREEFDA